MPSRSPAAPCNSTPGREAGPNPRTFKPSHAAPDLRLAPERGMPIEESRRQLLRNGVNGTRRAGQVDMKKYAAIN